MSTTTTNHLANLKVLARLHRAAIAAYEAAFAAYRTAVDTNLAAATAASAYDDAAYRTAYDTYLAAEDAAHKADLAYAVLNEARSAYDEALAAAAVTA